MSAIAHNWSYFTKFKQTFWSILGYGAPLKIFFFFFIEYKHKYLLLTEFEGRTVSYGPSFFLLDLWPQREARGP